MICVALLEKIEHKRMINITVIGFGYVGSSLSLLLLNSKHSVRLNIMEPEPECKGALLDLMHGISLCPNKELYHNKEELFLNADFIYYAAGTPNAPDASRLSTAQENIQLSKRIFKHRHFANTPYIIVITNPVDVISQAVYRYSQLPPDRIIGTGTFLDSMRLAYYLSTSSGHQPSDFETMVLGEHGASQTPIYSMCKIKGQALLDHSTFSDADLETAYQKTRDAAQEIRQTQGGTTYGVSMCACILLDYLLDTKEHQLCLSVLTNSHYQSLLELDDALFVGLPVKIKQGAVEIRNDIHLSSKELEQFRQSAHLLASINKGDTY